MCPLLAVLGEPTLLLIGSRPIAMRSYPGHMTGVRSDFAAADVMVRHPRVLPSSASIAEVVTSLDSEHVHMVLLTEGATLVGTLVRADLPADLPAGAYGDRPALALARLESRTVTPDAPAASVQRYLVERGFRRLAVVDADGALLGLMCLKQRQTGFCTDQDVAARALDPQVFE